MVLQFARKIFTLRDANASSRYVTLVVGFLGRVVRLVICPINMMKERVGQFLDKNSRKDVNLNEVFNNLEDLSVLGNTPKNQRYKGAFNIFESIAESSPSSKGTYLLHV